MSGLKADGLRTARAAAGMTQADLAQAIGVSRKTINTIENEVFVPSALLALRLAQVLGQPVEALFALSEPVGPPEPE